MDKQEKTVSNSIQGLLKLLNMQEAAADQQKPMDQYKFWKTQPVLAFDQDVDKEGPIETKGIDDVPKEPSTLHPSFEWSTIDIHDEAQLEEVYKLLYHNYIEDLDESFRFKYSTSFLKWALTPPGWKADWHVGVRAKESKKLVGFISGIPTTVRVHQNPHIKSVEINFLCVHKQLRSKRLTPVLVREVTRRVNATGIWQALFTAGRTLPTPVATARYYHRSINWQKLYDVNFAPLPSNSTVAKQLAKYALPNSTDLAGLRPMTPSDVAAVTPLLNKYLDRFDLAQVFTEDEVAHWFFDAKGATEQVVYSYVVEDPKTGTITDMFSFYGLESTVLGNDKYDTIKVSYAFYYATTSTNSDKELKDRLCALFQTAIILAKNKGYDVFNALTTQDNDLFLEKLKFGAGDGTLNFYLFNYAAFPVHGGISKTKELEYKPGGVGVVML